jgi:hypothetical protein
MHRRGRLCSIKNFLKEEILSPKSINGGHDALGQIPGFLVTGGGYGGAEANFHLVARRVGKIADPQGNKGQAVLGQMFLETQEKLNKPVFPRPHLIREIGAFGKKDELFPALQKSLEGPESRQGRLGALSIQGNTSQSFA